MENTCDIQSLLLLLFLLLFFPLFPSQRSKIFDSESHSIDQAENIDIIQSSELENESDKPVQLESLV